MAQPGNDTVTAVDLGAFCALWPFVRQPCASDAAALTAPARPWALLKRRESVRQTGLWPYCGMREPSLLESYAAPIGLAGRDLVLLGAMPSGDAQVAPLLLPLIGRLLDEKPAPPPPAGKGACRPRAWPSKC